MFSSERFSDEGVRRLSHGLGSTVGVSILLLVLTWAGFLPQLDKGGPASRLGFRGGLRHSVAHSAVATVTPTVTLTPPASLTHKVYLPRLEWQHLIPGSLSIEEVYTARYGGDRQTTFQPCQAVAMWVRMRNAADISQPATLRWRTVDPAGREHENLSSRRRVDVPPGQSAWRLLGAPDLGAPVGEYRYQASFTSGPDREMREGVMTVVGDPVPPRYLGGFTARVVTENYDFVYVRIEVPWREYVAHPVRRADVFTPEDEYVVQSSLWEGIRPDTVILTRRYRPDGRPWGAANYAFRGYDERPGCLRRQGLFWEVDDWMLQTPGQWLLKLSADGGETWQGELTFTLAD